MYGIIVFLDFGVNVVLRPLKAYSDFNSVCAIYRIHSVATDEDYVGATTNLLTRIGHHREELRHNRHASKMLQNLYDLYGLENLLIEILEECPLNTDVILDKETQWWLAFPKNLNRSQPTKINLNVQYKSEIIVTDRVKYWYWRKVVIPDDPNQCWGWTGKRKRGYPSNSKSQAIHRIAYLIHTKQQPGKMCVMHICDNPMCTNPLHLKLGNQKDNLIDRSQKYRSKFPNLNKDTVRKIRERALAGETYSELQREYGFPVFHIIHNYSWYDPDYTPPSKKDNNKVNPDDPRWEIARRIRGLHAEGLTAKEIGTKLGINPSRVYPIIANKVWVEV